MLTTELIPAAEKDSRKLMIVLHGLGDSMAGYLWLPEMLGIPSLNYLLVNAPDPYYGGYSWYDFAGNPAPGVERSRKMLSDLVEVWKNKGYRTEEMAFFGFSQGCLMTFEMGTRYPSRFAGLIGVSGYVHEPKKLVQNFSPLAKDQRFLITHGTHDPVVPIEEVRPQIALLKSMGLNIEWSEFPKAHTIAGEAELSVFRRFLGEIFPALPTGDSGVGPR